MTKSVIAKKEETSHDLAKAIGELAIEKKAEDVVLMNMREIAGFTDYFVIMTGNGNNHIKTLCDHIEKELSRHKVKVWHKEGYENLNWVLMDYIDVVVHIFDSQTRAHYDLETLWADAKKILVRDK